MPQWWLLLQERDEKAREHRRKGIEQEGTEIIFKKSEITHKYGDKCIK